MVNEKIAPVELLVEDVTSGTITVPLPTSSSSYLSTNVSISKDGYTPIGIVGWRIANADTGGANFSWVTLLRNYIGTSGGNPVVYVAFHNYHSSSDAVIKIQLWVLYQKNKG